MKNRSRLFAILVFSSISFFALAQNRITIDVEEFNSLIVSGRIDLELIPSESHEMSITARNGHPENVSVDILNGEMKIKLRTGFDKDDAISIKLPYSSLSHIEAAAGAVINSARDFSGKDLNLRALTGGKIELSLQVETIDAKITQISDIILYGQTNKQTVTVNTGGNYLAYDLECNESYIRATSGSQAKVIANNLIDANAQAKSFIGYIGDPSIVTIKTSLGGEISSFKTKKEANL